MTNLRLILCTCDARYLEYMQGAPPPEKKRKETLLSSDLGKFLDKKIRVKFQGGREGQCNSLNYKLQDSHKHIVQYIIIIYCS